MLEVIEIRRTEGDGKLRAIADVRYGEMIIRGFTVVDGKNGLFVSGPRKATKDGIWIDVIDATADLRRLIEDTVLSAYEDDGKRSVRTDLSQAINAAAQTMRGES